MKHDDCLFYVRDFRGIPADAFFTEMKCESCQYYDTEHCECMCNFYEQDIEDTDADSDEWYVWTGDKWLSL